jgi:hypothetical protein
LPLAIGWPGKCRAAPWIGTAIIFWFALLLSGIGSAGAGLHQYLKRDEREEITELRNRIMAMISKLSTAQSVEALLVMQRDVDTRNARVPR